MIPSTKKTIVRRKPGTAPGIQYFTMDHHNAIVEYNSTTDPAKRKEIYDVGIYPAFRELLRNLINNYKFRVSHEDSTGLQHEGIAFLYDKIGKFDHTRGTKAFSYFNMVCLRWLIAQSKSGAKHNKILSSLDDKDAFSQRDLEQIENYQVAPSPDELISHEEGHRTLTEVLDYIEDEAVEKSEALVMQAIRTLFENAEDIDLTNKRAITRLLAEITLLNPKQLNKALANLKKNYKSAKDFLEIEGGIEGLS